MSPQLPPPSEEQQTIVNSVIDGYHVLVDAVAGAGKTTTVLHIANAVHAFDRQVLALTYNAKLKSETRARCKLMGIINVAVHTYHSAAFHIYGDTACARDDGILKLLQQSVTQLAPKFHNAQYDILVVDEAQDMTHLYFALFRKLMRDVCAPGVQVVVLGDTRQAIYGFKKADARFLSMANQLSAYAPACRSWRRHPLATTYRLPPRVANFVNSQLLEGEQVLKSAGNIDRPQGRVRYVRCNTFGTQPFREIMSWLEPNSGLTASDIFILAPSIRKSTSPICVLENKLVSAGYPCYAASSDDDRLDEDVTRGKIVFATFHQVKGLERKAVLVFGFDASYHQYYERDEVIIGCPNAIYVAATRAMLHLTILHSESHAPMRTLRMQTIAQDCEFMGNGLMSMGGSGAASPMRDSSTKAVTDVLRFLTEDVLHAALACLTINPIVLQAHEHEQHSGQTANTTSTLLKSKTRTGVDLWESVSAITGTAMPCIFELKTSGNCTLLARAAKDSACLPTAHKERIKKLAACQDTTSFTTADFLFIANIHIALVEGFWYKLSQITVYDWLEESDVLAMMEVMGRHVTGRPGSVRYEVSADMDIDLPVAGRKIKMAGAVDCLDLSTNTAFEIKCVSELLTEHFLQTALNGLLLEMSAMNGQSSAPSASSSKSHRKHVLLNLNGGAAFEVSLGVGAEGAMRAAVILLEAKYAKKLSIDDVAFLASTVGPLFGQY